MCRDRRMCSSRSLRWPRRSSTCQTPSSRGGSRGTYRPAEMVMEAADLVAVEVAICEVVETAVVAQAMTAEMEARVAATLQHTRCTRHCRYPMEAAGCCSTPR
eukprot:7199145-Prymnesium_polylepis.2